MSDDQDSIRTLTYMYAIGGAIGVFAIAMMAREFAVESEAEAISQDAMSFCQRALCHDDIDETKEMISRMPEDVRSAIMACMIHRDEVECL